MMRAIATGGAPGRRGGDEGATAVEGAICLCILVTVIFGIIGFGEALWNWNTMMLAVEQAGRDVMVNNSCTSSSTCQSLANNWMKGVLWGSTQCSTSGSTIKSPTVGTMCYYAGTPTTGTPPTITLTAIYSYNVFFPAAKSQVTFGTFQVTSQATFPLD